MSFDQVADALPVEILRQFKRAIETGHWSNGLKLTDKQRVICEKALFLHQFEVDVKTH